MPERYLPVVRVTHHYEQFGKNPAVATSEEDIWDAGGEFPFATWDTGAQEIHLASSSASDTGAGAGVQSVIIKGLAGDGTEKRLTVTMSGTVSFSVGTWSFIHSLQGDNVGTSNTNVGNITAWSGGTLVRQMTAGFGECQGAQFVVPAGFEGFIQRVWGSSDAGEEADVRIYTRRAIGKCWLLFGEFHVSPGGDVVHEYESYAIRLPAGAAIRVKAVGSNGAGSVVTAGFSMLFGNGKAGAV